MRTRKLGNTNEELTTIGLGTWAFGGGDWAYTWGEQLDRVSVATIRRALDLGVNWIDTAPLYGLGHAECVVGRAIADRREDVFLVTKCGRVWNDGRGEVRYVLKAESIRRECEDSLRRLDVDVIDLYLIHQPVPEQDLEEAWTTVAALVDEGKVRYGGVSNFKATQIERLGAIHPVVALQPPYSMMRRGVEAETLGYCEESGIGVITYSPMLSGMLTGKMSRDYIFRLDKQDWRRNNRAFVEPRLSINLEFVEQLRPIAERNERSLPQLAVAWVLRRPEVASCIIGARRPEQLEATLPACDWILSPEDVSEIDGLLAGRDESLARCVE